MGKVCKNCRKPILGNRKRQVYCSPECRLRHQYQRAKAKKEDLRQWAGLPPEKRTVDYCFVIVSSGMHPAGGKHPASLIGENPWECKYEWKEMTRENVAKHFSRPEAPIYLFLGDGQFRSQEECLKILALKGIKPGRSIRDRLAPGMKVFHATRGHGVVRAVEGAKVFITFGSNIAADEIGEPDLRITEIIH